MIRVMRKTIVASALLLLLSACGGSEGEVACEMEYWDGTVGTCLPTGWHALDRAELDDRGVPTEVVAAFQSDNPTSGQYATITVTREALARVMTTPEYSEASVQSVVGLPNYDEVDQVDVTIDDDDVSLHVFTAQPNPEQPESRFYQVSAVADGAGYTFTAATPVSIDATLEEQVLVILRSATFVGPDGEEADDEEDEEA